MKAALNTPYLAYRKRRKIGPVLLGKDTGGSAVLKNVRKMSHFAVLFCQASAVFPQKKLRKPVVGGTPNTAFFIEHKNPSYLFEYHNIFLDIRSFIITEFASKIVGRQNHIQRYRKFLKSGKA